MAEGENDSPQFSPDTYAVYEAYGVYSAARSWQPMINIYEHANRMEVCVDLAGMDQRAIDVCVEPGRLAIRGTRPAPEPVQAPDHEASMRIVCMEIDYGSFERVIALPDRVEVHQVRSTYQDGLLWVTLPYCGSL